MTKDDKFNINPPLYSIPDKTIEKWKEIDDNKEIVLSKIDIDRLYFSINYAFMAINNINQAMLTGIPSFNTEAHSRLKISNFNFVTGLNELRHMLESLAATTFVNENDDDQ